MTPSEFKKIKTDFNKEQKRWKQLKIGESVYEIVPRFWDLEYFEVVIKKINVKERYIIGIDKSQNDKEVKLSHFSTVEELKQRGIEFENEYKP